MCKHLLKGCALRLFQKEMQDCEKQREGYVFYVLQCLSCRYISSDLCLLLKNHLYEIDFSPLVRELNSKRLFDLLEQYNLSIISFSVSLSRNEFSEKNVSEILMRKQSNYIGFETISNLDLILVYLHKIPVVILNFIYYKLMIKHRKPNLSILHHHISTIHDALDTFEYEKCKKSKKRK